MAHYIWSHWNGHQRAKGLFPHTDFTWEGHVFIKGFYPSERTKASASMVFPCDSFIQYTCESSDVSYTHTGSLLAWQFFNASHCCRSRYTLKRDLNPLGTYGNVRRLMHFSYAIV